MFTTPYEGCSLVRRALQEFVDHGVIVMPERVVHIVRITDIGQSAFP